MEAFEQTIGVVAAIVIGFMVLAFFFKLVGGKSKGRGAARALPSGLRDQVVTAHLSNKEVWENVRLSDGWPIGAENVPYGFSDMTTVEFGDGKRVLIRSKIIERIDVPSKTSGNGK
jgi:hypothetical protein